MSIQLNGSTQYLSNGSAVVSSYPFTLAAIVRSHSSTASQEIVVLSSSVSNNDWYSIILSGNVAGDPASIQAHDGTFELTSTITGYTVNQWHLVVGVFSSATSRSVTIDAGGKATGTTNIAAAVNQTAIGVLNRPSITAYFDGDVAHAGIWNVALSDDEVSQLVVKSTNPRVFRDFRTVRPGSLAAFWQLARTGSVYDLIGGFDLTQNNSPTTSEHPPIIRHLMGSVLPASGSAFQPAWATSATQVAGVAGCA